MSWIKRLLHRVAGGETAHGTVTAATAAPVPARRPVGKPVAISDATRATLREGFRSNASARERSTRPLAAIPVTHTTPTPVQARLGGGQGSTTPSSGSLPPSSPRTPAPPAKPRSPAGAAAHAEPALSGAAWATPAPEVQGSMNPADPAGVATTPWAMPTGEATGPSAFGELTGAAAVDLSPLSFLSPAPANTHCVDILGGAPSWSAPEVLARD